LTRALHLEVDVAHRRVVHVDAATIELNARGKCFGEREFVGEEARHVDEALVSAASRAGERHLEVTDGGGEQGRQTSLAGDVGGVGDIRIGDLEHLVHRAGGEKQRAGSEDRSPSTEAPRDSIWHRVHL